MKKLFTKNYIVGMLTSVLLIAASSAHAQSDVVSKVNNALNHKNLTEVQSMLQIHSNNVDDVVKALLKHTQKVLAKDPDFSSKMMNLAGQYAPKIKPPSVPVVCADLRRIVDSIPEGQVDSALSSIVSKVSEQFSKAPAVVSAGRPNQCETAFLRIAALQGQDPLLSQMPGMTGPGMQAVYYPPGIPPSKPTPEDKPSAD